MYMCIMRMKCIMYMCGALCICPIANVHNGKRDQAGEKVGYYAHVSDGIGACI